MKISLDLTAETISKLEHLKSLFNKTRSAIIREALNDLFSKYMLDESYRKSSEARFQPVVSEAFANPQETTWYYVYGERIYQTISVKNKRGTAMFDGLNWIPGMLGTFSSVELPDLLENWQEHGVNTEFYNMLIRNQPTSLNN